MSRLCIMQQRKRKGAPCSGRRQLFPNSSTKSELRSTWSRLDSKTSPSCPSSIQVSGCADVGPRGRRGNRASPKSSPTLTHALVSSIDSSGCSNDGEWSDSEDEDPLLMEGESPHCCNCNEQLSQHATISECRDGRRRYFCPSCPSPRKIRRKSLSSDDLTELEEQGRAPSPHGTDLRTPQRTNIHRVLRRSTIVERVQSRSPKVVRPKARRTARGMPVV